MKTRIRFGDVCFVVIFLAVGGVMIAGRRLQRRVTSGWDLILVGDHRASNARVLDGKGFRRSEQPSRLPSTVKNGTGSVSVKVLQTQYSKEPYREKKQVLRVAWTNSQRQKRSARLTLPPYWCVLAEGNPTVESWSMEGTHVMMLLIYASDSGTAEFSAPLFCHLTGSRCLPLASDVHPYSFSNHGSFYLQGKRLYVWDAIHEGADDTPNHRYELRSFVWRKGRYHLTSRRSTRRAYQPFVGGAGPGADLNPAQDPLKEFGMRWHWGMLIQNAP